MRLFHVLKIWEGDSTWCKKPRSEVKDFFNDAELAASVGSLKKLELEEKICKDCANAIIEALNSIKEEVVNETCVA